MKQRIILYTGQYWVMLILKANFTWLRTETNLAPVAVLLIHRSLQLHIPGYCISFFIPSTIPTPNFRYFEWNHLHTFLYIDLWFYIVHQQPSLDCLVPVSLLFSPQPPAQSLFLPHCHQDPKCLCPTGLDLLTTTKYTLLPSSHFSHLSPFRSDASSFPHFSNHSKIEC